MTPKIEWRRNDRPAHRASAGWEAYVGEEYVGQVFSDGSGFILAPPNATNRYRYVDFRSQALAAQALVRAVEAYL